MLLQSVARGSHRATNLLWRGETGQHLEREARGVIENGEQHMAWSNELIVSRTDEFGSQLHQVTRFDGDSGNRSVPRCRRYRLKGFDPFTNGLERAAELEQGCVDHWIT